MSKRNHAFSENIYWIFTLFGTAVGAGILFLPIQAGISGMFWVLVVSLFIYPITFFSHKLFAGIMLKTKQPRDFTGAVSEFLGSKFGLLNNILYFLLMFIALIAYSTGLNNDLGEFLFDKGGFQINPGDTPYLSLAFIFLFLLLLKFGKKLILKIAGVLSLVMIVFLLVISVSLIDMWDLRSISLFSNPKISFSHFLLFFPVLVTSFLFYPSISSMVINFRKAQADDARTASRIRRILLWCTVFLIFFTMFFVFSCLLSIPYKDFKQALQENISVLSLLSMKGQKAFLSDIEPLVSIFALSTSFIGVSFGLRDSGIELLKRIRSGKENKPFLSDAGMETIVFIVAGFPLWLFTIANFSVLDIFGGFVAPLSAVFLFLLPVIIFYRIRGFERNEKYQAMLVFVVGVMLLFSYMLGKLMGIM